MKNFVRRRSERKTDLGTPALYGNDEFERIVAEMQRELIELEAEEARKEEGYLKTKAAYGEFVQETR